MNKLFTKIAGVTLGFAMAIGVGVAVAGKQDVKAAKAEEVTYKLTIDDSDFNTTSYAANNNEKTSNAVCTTDNTKTYEVKWTSYQIMKNSGMQWQKNKGAIYNSTDLGTITAVTITKSAGSFTTYYGTSEQPSSGTTVGNGFFKTVVGGATGTTSKVEVTFKIEESGDPTTYTDVTVSEKTPLTGQYKGSAYYECQATVSGTGSYSNAVTWSLTSTTTYGTGTSVTDKASIDNTGKIIFLDNCTVYAWATAADGETHNTAGFVVTASSLEDNPVSAWTKVTSLANVSTSKIYALSNDGEQFSVGAVESKKLALTSTFEDIGYFALEEVETNKYYVRFATKDINDEWDLTTGLYLKNVSGDTEVSSAENNPTTWTATENSTNGVYLVGNGTRHLGVSGTAIKAYANVGTYPPAYLYEVETIPTKELVSIELAGTYPTAFKQGDAFSHEGMTVTANYDNGAPKDVTSLATFTGYNMSNPGEQEVTVSYTEGEITKTAKYNITISESIILAGENFSMAVGDDDVAPVIKIKDTSTVVEGCTFTTSNAAVASIVNNKVHAVKRGTATITAAHADADNKTYTSATFTVTVTKIDTIEDIYSMANNDSLDVYGYYAGKHSDGIILMDGEYGIIAYKATADTTWVVDETVIHVTGTRTSYNGLVEIAQGCTVTKVTGEEEAAAKAKLSVPTNYTLTGSETYEDTNLANRRAYVSGELTDITADGTKGYYYTITNSSSVELTVYLKTANDNTVTYHDEDGNEQTAKLSAYLTLMLNKNVTIKGFTSIFNNGSTKQYFQVLAYDIVEADNSFTVELFAQMILDETDGVCKNDNTTDLAAITAKWNKLGGEEGWEKLSTAERAKFQDHDVTPNYDAEAASSHTVLENALGRYNVICKRYFQNNNFANRYDVNGAPVTPTESNSMFGANESNDVATIVVIIAIASISAFGCLLILKKRKHQ